ncbi:Bax inhibitor-1/YccA family protein [Cohnella lubricantis]|uniref:Bax inhibitor-1/YccA family protein n=1 Tax=Cohnella lubricantis TaxID=2163172 RepID=A0A841TAN0_9BACL|nr:Bax inhibitor-1/YccA family protein [Cohnella lubricantis]MBB6676310.1 Bax inhibitor-1/YccA family protein [Cohnella lubricantis]MBP2119620.1 putative YccA/Bax inhibitor family protein [Cohnella lubricantis]
MIGRSGNPTLKEDTFKNTGTWAGSSPNVMTIDGTVNKSFIMLALLMGGALVSWSRFNAGDNVTPYVIFSVIAGFVLSLIISFRPTSAPYLAPIYAVLEGVFLGALSAMFESLYNGITMQAALLTAGVFLAMLLAYKTRVIRATNKFKLIVFSATLGIALVYLINFVLSFFGLQVPYLNSNGWLGIGISLVIVGVAALNLVLDFDFIEEGSRQGAPKYMEWYGAFGLLVTLVWLYVEMLRLLAKIFSRD